MPAMWIYLAAIFVKTTYINVNVKEKVPNAGHAISIQVIVISKYSY